MSKAPLPEQLPGDFFVLVWDRDREVFILHVDDADRSSYMLGGEVPKLMLQFRLWGYADIGNRSIDMAKEFGAVQTIPEQNRTIALFNRDKNLATQLFKEEESRHAKYPDFIPPL